MSLITTLVALGLLSVLAFWKPNPHLFMIMAGMSLMLGLAWFDIYTNELGLGMSLGFIGYSFMCIGFTFKEIFFRDEEQ